MPVVFEEEWPAGFRWKSLSGMYETPAGISEDDLDLIMLDAIVLIIFEVSYCLESWWPLKRACSTHTKNQRGRLQSKNRSPVQKWNGQLIPPLTDDWEVKGEAGELGRSFEIFRIRQPTVKAGPGGVDSDREIGIHRKVRGRGGPWSRDPLGAILDIPAFYNGWDWTWGGKRLLKSNWERDREN